MILTNSKLLIFLELFFRVYLHFNNFHSFQGYAGFGGGVFPTLFQSICNRVNSKNQIDQVHSFIS